MNRSETPAFAHRTAFAEDLRKLPAFFRRDLLVVWSYRMSFFTDWVTLVAQVIVFFFVDRLIDPSKVPSFGGRAASYMSFVVIGIVVTSFTQVSFARVLNAIRTEQLQGTLETLLTTPTAPTTFLLGSALYELAYVPIRAILFLTLAAVLFDVSFSAQGLLPAAGVLVVLVPAVWGLGLMGAGGVLTFRRGAGILGVAVSALTITSSTYFPIAVLPERLQPFARANPITIALEAIRSVLLGGEGWGAVWPAILTLLPVAAVSLLLGIMTFRWAMGRERRKGTLGLY